MCVVVGMLIGTSIRSPEVAVNAARYVLSTISDPPVKLKALSTNGKYLFTKKQTTMKFAFLLHTYLTSSGKVRR